LETSAPGAGGARSVARKAYPLSIDLEEILRLRNAAIARTLLF
jgi:hypothetical protein